MSKGKNFVPGFVLNFQVTKEYNPEWTLEMIIVFNWLIFKGHKSNWEVVASITDFKKQLRINRRKLATILGKLEELKVINRWGYVGGTTEISINLEYLMYSLEEVFNAKSANYDDCCSWFFNLTHS